MKRTVLIFFVAVSLGELLSGIVGSRELHLICKPLIMVVLGIYYWIASSGNRSTVVVSALFFSFAGDTALMFESSDSLFFIAGLIAFLISHVLYILAYRQHQRDDAASDALQGIQKLRFAFPVVLAGTGLVVVLYPVLGDLKFPVMIYALVMVIMVLNALFRLGRTSAKSFQLVVAGAVAFMVSDSLLAINKFLTPVDHADLLIMGTYILAQFLIVEGLCAHLVIQKKQRP